MGYARISSKNKSINQSRGLWLNFIPTLCFRWRIFPMFRWSIHDPPWYGEPNTAEAKRSIQNENSAPGLLSEDQLRGFRLHSSHPNRRCVGGAQKIA
jgi:hypothetical protein